MPRLSLFIHDMSSHLKNRIYSFLYVLSNENYRFCPAAMRTLQQALLAAVKSLLRTSERLHSLFATWYIRLLHDRNVPSSKQWKSPDDFAIHVRHLLGVAVNSASLRKLSLALQGQFKVALMSDPRCMLPSYNHQLPHGQESGKFLALDVGGSTFRVALIELLGPQSEGEGIKIQSLKSYKIDNDVKHLEGLQFFDWLAGKIQDTLSGQDVGEVVLSTGLAWSFPIEYVIFPYALCHLTVSMRILSEEPMRGCPSVLWMYDAPLVLWERFSCREEGL